MPADQTCVRLFGLCFSNHVDVGSFLSVVLFVAGIFVATITKRKEDNNEKLKDQKREIERKRRHLVALSEEVGLNVQSLDKFVQKFPGIASMAKFLRSAGHNRPIITFTYNKTIFINRTEVLEDLSDIIIRNIVEFYGKLEEISFDCESIDYSAFTTISFEGREAMILDIESQSRIALQQGKSLRDAIAQHLLDTKG